MAHDPLDPTQATLAPRRARGPASALTRIALTVLWHPEWGRVGDIAELGQVGKAGAPVGVGRLEPTFRSRSHDASEMPLAEPYLSRSGPVFECRSDGSVRIDASLAKMAVRVDGQSVSGVVELSAPQVARGTVVSLADRVVLLVGTRKSPWPPVQADLGIIGESDGIVRLRDTIRRLADADASVLIRGPSGSGKERVAQALHSGGRRARGAFVAINAASVPANLAASELFGHVKGAFSGADSQRIGAFRQAHGGTLFLDEVGEMPVDVQVQLLRVLETRQVQPLGSDRSYEVDVRVVSATDAPLEQAAEDGSFRAPLMHRLAGFELHVPRLAERIEDLGRLLVFFLRAECARAGIEGDPSPDAPVEWVPGELAEQLALHPWPGNVRELRNVASRIALLATTGGPVTTDAIGLREPLGQSRPPTSPSPSASSTRPADGSGSAEVTEDDLIAALRAVKFNIGAAAKSLGIPRATAYDLIDRSDRIRKAVEIPEDEIRSVLEAAGGVTSAAAERLEVSERALKIRMKSLGI